MNQLALQCSEEDSSGRDVSASPFLSIRTVIKELVPGVSRPSFPIILHVSFGEPVAHFGVWFPMLARLLQAHDIPIALIVRAFANAVGVAWVSQVRIL